MAQTHNIMVAFDQEDLARLEAVAARIEAASERLAPGSSVVVNWNSPDIVRVRGTDADDDGA